jgi:large subunit ribosomal protein L2
MVYYFLNKLKKKLNIGYSFTGGRNNKGRICIRGQGGGHKRNYRFIDFFRRLNLRGRVINLIYDPNRTARLAVLIYLNSFSSYILLQKNVRLNSILYAGSLPCEEPLIDGYSIMLKYMPLFSNISNIELKPFKGSTLCRAANTSCILIGKKADKGILQLNSK